MENGPRKRYGKDAVRQQKSRALASLAESGVSQQAIRKKPGKTDEVFLDSLIQTLHGVAIGLDSRDMANIAGLERFIEARTLSFKIHRKFAAIKGNPTK